MTEFEGREFVPESGTVKTPIHGSCLTAPSGEVTVSVPGNYAAKYKHVGCIGHVWIKLKCNHAFQAGERGTC